MIDGRNFFDQPINSMTKTYENIRKIATGKGDDYATRCLLDCLYFKENYKMMAVDLSRQNELDSDPRAIQQVNFTANLEREIQQYFSLLKKQKKLFSNFHRAPEKFCKCSSIEIFSFKYIK